MPAAFRGAGTGVDGSEVEHDVDAVNGVGESETELRVATALSYASDCIAFAARQASAAMWAEA